MYENIIIIDLQLDNFSHIFFSKVHTIEFKFNKCRVTKFLVISKVDLFREVFGVMIRWGDEEK